MKFEIRKRDAAGRIGRLTTNHGVVQTPLLLPVINPNKMIITPQEMQELLGIQMVITNGYIINKDKRLREQALAQGVHSLIGFDGPIMTDSGTFQSYVYGDVSVQPEEIVAFQRDIGSDIGTILDIFSTPNQTEEQAKNAIQTTINRAEKSIKLKQSMALACPVQGSIYPELRAVCAKALGSLDADLYPIGGVVPLMEQQRYTELLQVILASKKQLPINKPVHLFGAGHPLIFPIAVALGCDIFDSSAYIKYALEERMLFSWGTLHLEDIDELPCCCPVCSTYSVHELKSQKKNELTRNIALHNLYVSVAEIKKIRNAIHSGTLWDLVEQKASENPYLFQALLILREKQHKKWLELFEPVRRKKAVRYTGPQTMHRPILYRAYQRLLDRYIPLSDTMLLFEEKETAYNASCSSVIFDLINEGFDIDYLINSPLGPVPFVLQDMYPFAQSIFPPVADEETRKIQQHLLSSFTQGKKVIPWEGEKTKKHLNKTMTKTQPISLNEQKAKAIATMQFGRDAAKVLFSGSIKLIISKKTGKIRNVYVNDNHILSLRASDGLFTLKLAGAILVHEQLPAPALRVVVDDEAVSFIKDGKSVFAQFVLQSDPQLRPYDECLIVSNNDTLLAVGQCILNSQEMMSFQYGQAVKNRDHISNEK